MKAKNHILSLIVGGLIIVFLAACSQEKNTLLSRSYHNVTARYNSYFLARERLYEIDRTIQDQQEYDYNDFLRYYPIYDSNRTKSFDQDFAYIVDKAKIPINKHKNSNWVDDSYILIGKCKMYREKLDSAALIFKYTNTKSDYDPDRFKALCLLMRTYMAQNDYKQASEVYSYLQRQELAKDNLGDFHLAAYEFFRTDRIVDSMSFHMEKAIPHIKGRDNKSRALFIAGQLRQRLGNDKEAYDFYKKVLRKTPPYELEFNTRVNLVQVTELNDKNTLTKIKKYFVKLLEDEKNREFEDRIYYEMARFELRQNNVSAAFKYLHKSLHSQGQTPRQKAYSYLMMGKLHYYHIDTLPKVEKYTIAKKYYDSTVANLDEFFYNSQEILDRQKDLSDFVEQITIVYTQDSLLRLASLSEEELALKVEEIKAKQEVAMKEEYERKKRAEELAERQAMVGQNQNQANFKSNFVFYDQLELPTSKLKFLEVWGERKLEDNWRRSNKEIQFEDENEISNQDSLVDTLVAVIDSNEVEDKEPSFEVSKESILADIPFSDEAKVASLAMIDEAQYQLGKIYHFQLLETENAIEEFDKHLERFLKSEHRPEILYLMYLICQENEICDPEPYAQKEKGEYPNSIYSKLIQNPNYLSDNEGENAAAHRAYESAYKQFQRRQFLGARKSLAAIKASYPANDIMDNIHLLEAMTYAKTDQMSVYIKLLEEFITSFKTSDLQNYALDLLNQAKQETVNNNLISLSDTNYTDYPEDSVRLFLMDFKYSEINPAEAKAVVSEFHDMHFPKSGLSYRSVDFTDSTFLVVVNSFSKKDIEKEYIKKFLHFIEFRTHYENVTYNHYFINFRNYQVLLNTKALTRYSEFYRRKSN